MDFNFTMKRPTQVFDYDPAFTGHVPPVHTRQNYIVLIQAIRNGNKIQVQQLIDNGAPVNCHLPNHRNLTPLHWAVQSRSLEVVKILLDKGANINAKSWDGNTPLILAAKTENSTLIDSLLSQNVQYCKDSNNFSHLHIASMRNRVDIVSKLLSINQGEYVNKPVGASSLIWQGYTPLHFAIHYSCAEVVEYLLECGADMMIRDARGLTPLHLAHLQQNEKMIDLLLSAHKAEFENPASPEGLTHFHIACTRDDASIVERFLKLMMNVDLPVSTTSDSLWKGWRPIHFAMYYECPKVIKLLLETKICLHNSFFHNLLKYQFIMGNNLIYNLFTKNTENNSSNRDKHKKIDIFHIASGSNHVALMEDFLIDPQVVNAQVDFNVPIRIGDTPLQIASKCKSIDAAKFLLDHEADIMIQDYKGRTPFHIAFYNKCNEILEMIADKMNTETRNVIDNQGLSLFHILCTMNKIEIIKTFLHTGVDINAQVWNQSALWAGFTPLHLACASNQSEVVELLLDNHAIILIKNKSNLNPYDLVIEKLIADHSSERQKYFQILKILFSNSSQQVRALNARGISLLHILCLNRFIDKNHLHMLQKCLITHRDEINSIIELNQEHEYNNCTPLHLAVKFGHLEIARLMLKNGADPLKVNSEGRTPLEYLHCNRLPVPDDLAKTLFTFVTVNHSSRPSHFHLACGMGRAKVVKCVLEVSDASTKTIFVKCRDDRGRTPLHALLESQIPSVSEKRQIARLLLDNGANVNARDFELRTPLHCAVLSGDLDIIKLFIGHGADVNAHDLSDTIPLIEFRTKKNAEGIATLLENGADINMVNIEGRTGFTGMLYDSANIIFEIEDAEDHDKGLKCIVTMLKHMKKLQLIGLNVSEKNREAFGVALHLVDFDEAVFIVECKKELETMMTVDIDRYTTLRDILSKSLNEMEFHCENADLRRMVESNDFCAKFPIYGHLVKLQIKNGATRRSLLLEAKKSLTNVFEICLPQVCLERIVQYLSEKDLKNIVISVTELGVNQIE